VAKFNIVFVANCGLGITLALSCVSAMGGASGFLKDNATKAGTKQMAVQSATDLRAEKLDHSKQLAALASDPKTVILTTRQKSAAAISGNLQTMRSVLKPGAKVTIGGENALAVGEGFLVIDEVGAVAITDADGFARNPFRLDASHLPILTTTQIQAMNLRKQFKSNDLFVTPPEKVHVEPIAAPEAVGITQPVEVKP
jgi:hypothetical protein